MIEAEIKGTRYKIPTSWFDVPYTKGVEVFKLKEPDDILCALIGLDKEVLIGLKGKSVATLFNCIKFVDDVTCVNSELPQEKYKDIDYGSLPYGTTEAVKIIIKNSLGNNLGNNFMDIAPDVIKKLTDDDISNEPFAEVIGSVGFFLNQWMAFTKDSMSLTKTEQLKSNNSQELTGSNGSELLVLG
jgi:hypothetical protein